MPPILMPYSIGRHPEERPQAASRRTRYRPAVVAALASMLLVAGCGGNGLGDFDIGFGGSTQHSSAGDWIKPGAQPGESASAYGDCQSIARQATQKDADIDQDIAATRGADLQRSQIVQMRSSQQRGTTAGDADSILASCMQQKGFVERR